MFFNKKMTSLDNVDRNVYIDKFLLFQSLLTTTMLSVFCFSVFLLLFILSAVLPEFFCLAACSHLCHPFSSCLRLTPLCQLPVFAVWAEVSSLR